jgi:hypothetical protein
VLHGPFVVLFEQDRVGEAHDRRHVWEDGDDLGAPLELAFTRSIALVLCSLARGAAGELV